MVLRKFSQKRAKVLRSKVFARLFQKAAQVEGAQPSSRPQARNIRRFWFFLRQFCQKERRKATQCKKRAVVWMKSEKIVSVLFEQRGPKRTKTAV